VVGGQAVHRVFRSDSLRPVHTFIDCISSLLMTLLSSNTIINP
jgi:hypothetical protein